VGNRNGSDDRSRSQLRSFPGFDLYGYQRILILIAAPFAGFRGDCADSEASGLRRKRNQRGGWSCWRYYERNAIGSIDANNLATQATSNVLDGVRSHLVPEAKAEAALKWKPDYFS